MAKKTKTKKKAGKKAQPKPRKPKIDPQILLLQKIDRIKDRIPDIEPTGECRDKETDELLFRYTEAQHVFKVYRAECDVEGLHYRPYADEHIQPRAVAVGNMPMLIATFCIEDIKTGARIIGCGTGMGRNLDWSGNTANTRALKQFLLTTFEATWEDPEDLIVSRGRMREQVISELEADGTLSRIEQIRYWAQNLGKGKKDESSTKGKDTKDGGRTNRAKNRARKKRHNR
jgi:hypothetical protein